MDRPLRIILIESQYERPDPMMTGDNKSGFAEYNFPVSGVVMAIIRALPEAIFKKTRL